MKPTTPPETFEAKTTRIARLLSQAEAGRDAAYQSLARDVLTNPAALTDERLTRLALMDVRCRVLAQAAELIEQGRVLANVLPVAE